MSENQNATQHVFEAEVAQLLHLVTHSLYSNSDIFVRELVSNASDACDKLRFEATSDDSLYEDDGELKVRIDIDTEAKTITFIDNGIGMNEADTIENLGTIAKSGTKAFLEQLSESQKQDGQLIGQFGVGFTQALSLQTRLLLNHVKRVSLQTKAYAGYLTVLVNLPLRASPKTAAAPLSRYI
nr:ATP-binding protein [Psychrobacter sp. PraFG1]UNK06508.1 ATP-binding protein [Psychrobacter sp. PraFG1]